MSQRDSARDVHSRLFRAHNSTCCCIQHGCVPTNVMTVLHSRPDCVVTRVKISSLTENINRLTVAHHEE